MTVVAEYFARAHHPVTRARYPDSSRGHDFRTLVRATPRLVSFFSDTRARSTCYGSRGRPDPRAALGTVFAAARTRDPSAARRHGDRDRGSAAAADARVVVGVGHVRRHRVRGQVVGRRRLRAGPGHRVPGRQAAGVRQLAGETGQAERGRQHRDHRQEEAGGPRGGPVQAAAAEQAAPAAAGEHVAGAGHRRVLRHAHAEDITAVDPGRRHRPGTRPTE